jgi:hypothetical protein
MNAALRTNLQLQYAVQRTTVQPYEYCITYEKERGHRGIGTIVHRTMQHRHPKTRTHWYTVMIRTLEQ